jgi:hypoxanthine phosphoribosyltransferase
MLERKELLKDVFKAPNYLIIVSPNIDVNGDFDMVKGKNVYKLNAYSPELVNNIMQTQKNIITKHGRKNTPSVLLVLDDILDQPGCLTLHSMVERIFTRGRHVHVSVILVSQQLRRISKCMRTNADMAILFCPNNYRESEEFIEEYIPKQYRKKMALYLKDMWDENSHAFLTIDFQAKDINRRFRKNLSEPILLDSL